MWPLIVLLTISVVGLGRSVLIVMGLYKDPILWSFEEYGPDERLPMPLLTLTVWVGAFLICLGLWTSLYLPIPFPLVTAGIILLVASLVAWYYHPVVTKAYYRFVPFPRWQHELLSRTTRYERRRIAYMWMHLPWRLRLTYNSSDSAFFIWADFVIMGTIREEEADIFDEHFYAGR